MSRTSTGPSRLALACVLMAAATPPVAVAAGDRPHPPRIAWTGAGQTVATGAFTFCWPGADGTRGLCADGVPPVCAPPGAVGMRLLVPVGRAVRVRAVLGFRPKSVHTEAYANDGTGRRWRRPATRTVDIRVGARFEGRVGVFATRAGAAGGDAAYAVCVIRVTPG